MWHAWSGASGLAWALGLGWTLLVGGAGGAVTVLGPWYYGLRKPSWQPPDWAFGPAWTLILLLAGLAFTAAWTAAPDLRRLLLAVWVANALLNVLWSTLFFLRRRPDLALLEVAPLWLSIAAMAWVAARAIPWLGWLLAPYLAWVAFAAVLNRAIARLNGPFGPT